MGVMKVGRAEFAQHAAVAQNHDPVGPGRDRRLVRHDDDGEALLSTLIVQQPAEVLAGHRIEAAGRLVGQNDRRIGHQGAGDGHALLFAAAQGVLPVASAVAETQRFNEVIEPPVIGRRASVREDRQQDVLLGGEGRNEVERLKDKPDPPSPQTG